MEAIRTHSKKKVPVIAVDEEELRTHVSEVVRQSVEETLNNPLDAADTHCKEKALWTKRRTGQHSRWPL